jgi:hypothetical protein
VRAFERLVLIPLDIVAVLGAIICLVHKSWLAGIILLFLSLVIGIIGQSLHPKLSAKELSQGKHWNGTPVDDSATRSTSVKSSNDEIAELLWTEWVGKADRTILTEICDKEGVALAPLEAVLIIYEIACIYVTFGSKSEQLHSPVLGSTLACFTALLKSHLGDQESVDLIGEQLGAITKRIACLLDGLGPDRKGFGFDWARESLLTDFGIDENNPVVLFQWAHNWTEYCLALFKVCDELQSIYSDPT